MVTIQITNCLACTVVAYAIAMLKVSGLILEWDQIFVCPANICLSLGIFYK